MKHVFNNEKPIDVRTVGFAVLHIFALCYLVSGRCGAADALLATPVNPLDPITAYDLQHDYRKNPTAGPKWLPFDQVVPQKARWKKLRLVGPRGGVASGVVVASQACPAKLAEPLSGKTGTIAAKHVSIRYGTYRQLEAAFKKHSRGIWRQRHWQTKAAIRKNGGKLPENYKWWNLHCPYTLCEKPQERGGVHPIWLTVDIPRTARPGIYKSTIQMAGKTFPVELTVAPYLLPKSEDMVAYIGCMWSYDRLADTFKLKAWSPEHLDKVTEFHGYLNRLGNKVLVITVLADNYLADKHGMLRFRKTQGGLVPDWSVVDTVLERYIAEVCMPTHLVFHIWAEAAYGVKPHGPQPKAPDEVLLPVTVVEKDGTLSTVQITPPYLPGHTQLWQRIFKELGDRLEKHNIPKTSLILGDSSDARPRTATVKAFEKLGYNNWSCCSHGRGVVVPDKKGEEIVLGTGMMIGYWEPVYAPGMTPRKDGILGGWNTPFIYYSCIRNYLQPYDPLRQYRGIIDAAVVTGEVNQKALDALDPKCELSKFARLYISYGNSAAGLTRVPVLPGDHTRNALQKTFCNIIRGNPRFLLTADGDTLQPTAKILVLLEGRNETEARITLEKSLLGKRLPKALEKEVREFLYKRTVVLTRDGTYAASAALWGGDMFDTRFLGASDDWPGMANRLYELAGKAQELKADAKQIAVRPTP